MGGNTVIDISARLARKRDLEKLKERIAASGWDIDSEDVNLQAELCVYLIDSKESCVVLFCCNKDSFPDRDINPEDIVHWGHFVLAWDVIADPTMPFDRKHKEVTIGMVRKALLGVEGWPDTHRKLFGTADGNTPHLLVVIDRDNSEFPLDLIVARTNSPVLNSESVHKIVNNYISANEGNK